MFEAEWSRFTDCWVKSSPLLETVGIKTTYRQTLVTEKPSTYYDGEDQLFSHIFTIKKQPWNVLWTVMRHLLKFIKFKILGINPRCIILFSRGSHALTNGNSTGIETEHNMQLQDIHRRREQGKERKNKRQKLQTKTRHNQNLWINKE